MPDSTPISTSISSTITIEEYHDLLEIARVACHRIPNILTDELDISDEYLNQLEDIANAIPSPAPTSPLEDENKELRLLAREALDTLRLMRDETSKGYAMIMSDSEVRSRAALLWDRLRKFYYY